MKKWIVAAVALTALSAQAKVNVVATLSDLGAIARSVGGNDVEVTILGTPTEDPHFVEAKPNKVLELSRADLLVLDGMDLEIGWLPVLQTSSRNGKVQVGANGYLDCSTFIAPKEIPQQKLDRAMGDIHPGGNPHYTRDPNNAIRVANGIAARLGQLDPDHAKAYQANAAAFAQDLQQRESGWKKALAPYAGTPIVVYHKSWVYFTDWAGLKIAGEMEPKPGLPPSSGHVFQVFNLLKTQHVPLILQEVWYSPATSQLLASKTGAQLVRVQGMPALDQSYGDFMDQMVKQVVAGLAAAKK